MVNFPTWIPDFDSHSPALLNLFVSSDADIYSERLVTAAKGFLKLPNLRMLIKQVLFPSIGKF